MAALSWIFSRPVSSGWKPAPSSIKGETLPRMVIWPEVGVMTPAISFRIVDLPEPLGPIIPTV